VRADELLIGIAPDLRGGDGGTGGEGRPAGLATGGKGGAGDPAGQPGLNSGTLEPGTEGAEGPPGRMYFYVNWNVVPFDPFWQFSGNPGCGGPFSDTDDEQVTRTGFVICGGQCLSHLVNMDSEHPFVLEFDYRWLTTSGSMEIRVGDQLVHSVSAPAVLNSGFTRESVVLTDPSLRSPFFQTLQICVLPDESASIQIANLSFRADPNAGTPPPDIGITKSGNGSQVDFSWNSIPGQTYQLQHRPSLTEGLWSNHGLPIPGTGAMATASAPIDPGGAEGYYRVVVLPAE
jgi:hypothetical protein